LCSSRCSDVAAIFAAIGSQLLIFWEVLAAPDEYFVDAKSVFFFKTLFASIINRITEGAQLVSQGSRRYYGRMLTERALRA